MFQLVHRGSECPVMCKAHGGVSDARLGLRRSQNLQNAKKFLPR